MRFWLGLGFCYAALVAPAAAQNAFAFKLGYSGSFVSGSHVTETSGGMAGGFYYEIDLSEPWQLTVGAGMTTRRATWLRPEVPYDVGAAARYVQLPVLLQYRVVTQGRAAAGTFIVQAGPWLASEAGCDCPTTLRSLGTVSDPDGREIPFRRSKEQLGMTLGLQFQYKPGRALGAGNMRYTAEINYEHHLTRFGTWELTGHQRWRAMTVLAGVSFEL